MKEFSRQVLVVAVGVFIGGVLPLWLLFFVLLAMD